MKRISITITLGAVIAFAAVAAPTLGIRTRLERPPEMDAITVAEVEFNAERFSFVVPRNWRLEPDLAGRTIQLSSELSRAVITVQFSEQPAESVLKSTDTLREFAAPGLITAKVIEEFPVYSGGGQGKGALFANGTEARSRVAVVPLGRGCVSFVLSCRASDAPAQQTFGALITSFRKAASR